MLNDVQIPSLNAIHSFVIAARHLSFTKAAQELHVTTGAVSRMVRLLEQDIGVPLFKRVGSLLELTPAGSAYHTQLHDSFDRIAAATRAIRGLQNNNVLSIAALPTFTMRWLAPRLSGFQNKHPDILLDLIMRDFTQEELLFADKRFEIIISYGAGHWPGMEATLLMHEQVGVYCAPSFLKRRAAIRTPKDLSHYPLLLHSTRPNAWDEYFHSFGISSYTKQPAVGYEHFFMVIEAASSGMGLALLPTIFAGKEVADGRLTQAIPHTLRTKSYYMVHPTESGDIRKIRLFKKWLLNEISDEQASSPSILN